MDKLIEKYAKVPAKQRYAAAALIVAALVVGFWQLVYSEQIAQVEQLEGQYRQLEQERAEKQAYVDNLAKYEARLTELQQRLNEARAQLPDDADVPQLLAQLDNRARQAGLEIARFEPRGEQPQDFYAEVGFEMKVRGSYHEIGSFVDSVGKLDRIVNVMGISMTDPKTENQKVLVTGDFTIKAYRFIEGTAQAPAKKTPAKGGKK